MKKIIYKILIYLRIKKQFNFPPLEYEVETLKKAYYKIFKPTIDCGNNITKGGEFKINLSFKDLKKTKHTEQFSIKTFKDDQPGLKFRITLPKILNVGGVLYKESYGLSEELVIENKDFKLFIPEGSVDDFETKFPSQPQFLDGRFHKLKSSNEKPENSYCRLVIPSKDTEMVFPSSILHYRDNHMKFDYSGWEKQMTLLGIPMLSTESMFAELTIKKCKFHFYALKPLNSQIIDSIDLISIEQFLTISDAIRLCFAFLSGKFYKNEVLLVSSSLPDFSIIDYFEYQDEGSSILTNNQIINPSFFFSEYSEKDQETRTLWEEYHKMFGTDIFSSICEKIIDSPDFMRCIELIVNAGNINDPIQKGALYSVSIETITELLKSENEESFKPIQNNQIWRSFNKDLNDRLEKIKNEIPDDGYKILQTKINNLNSPTNREKLVKPFKLVGIELTENDLISLEGRNNYLHGGHPEDLKWILKSNLTALRLHYLIGMLVLKYFKYSGHYINLLGWFLLHDRETIRIVKEYNIDELMEILKQIENNDFKRPAQVERAKQIIENFKRYSSIQLEVQGLIKII